MNKLCLSFGGLGHDLNLRFLRKTFFLSLRSLFAFWESVVGKGISLVEVLFSVWDP